MPVPLADQIMDKVNHIEELYYQLLVVVAPSGAGKTAALQKVHESTGATLLNINLELSRRLLDLTERQRALYIPRILKEIVSEHENNMILLDNIEILFEISLKQDPLRLLQGLSRNKTVIVAWNGSSAGENLTYATAEHPEYKRYPTKDLLIVHSEDTT